MRVTRRLYPSPLSRATFAVVQRGHVRGQAPGMAGPDMTQGLTRVGPCGVGPGPPAAGDYPTGVAVLIASNLRKELAGDPLFDGVSFKVERRDRVALSGANGAGKTTLLRALAGETTLQGGELAFQKGTRVALHDQRPPLQRGLALREYVLAGASDLVAAEEELRRLERAMADRDHAQST